MVACPLWATEQSESWEHSSKGGFSLRNIPLSFIKHFRFNNIRQFHYSFIVFAQRILSFCREDRNAVVNTVVKGDVMTFETKLPINGIEVVFFVGKVYIQILAQDIGYMVEFF